VEGEIAMKLPKGIKITQAPDQSNAPIGHMTFNIKIAKWYIPILFVKALWGHEIPLKYWPVALFKYYTRKSKSS
jgi:hypothetical protein